MAIVVIMRGLSGSGKSTMAKNIKSHMKDNGYGECVILSNDDYPGYYVDGVYTWTPKAAKEARQWCMKQFDKAIEDSFENIIVDNTNLNIKAYGYYQKKAEAAGYQVAFNVFRPVDTQEYIEQCAKRNTHHVKAEHLRQMLKAWQD